MELTILGSGTSVPHPQRAASASWLQTPSGSLLLDMSAVAVHRMAQEGLDWPNLDAVWISHFHLDHLGGLAPFLFGIKHAAQAQERRQPLNIFGGRGLEQLFRAIDEAGNFKLFKQKFPVQFCEVEPGASFQILPNLQASTFKTPHTGESLALRLEDERGVSLVYTSDTGYAEDLCAFARGAHLLLMECSFVRDKPVETHLELSEAMRLATLAMPQKVLLTHLYPEWDGVDLASEARKLWDGETIAATDGLRLKIGK
ncbi:MAG TPA: MBL fold metallo-hydrolase [Pyrinomonadaceae bacterium]|nr:MBL fold metallo-hydrolase [Pyrinomonadaceae bacterium]